MTISLSARQRVRFRTDLLAHREAFSLNDAEYADQVLKVSLNTYKKCVQLSANKSLALKRHTLRLHLHPLSPGSEKLWSFHRRSRVRYRHSADTKRMNFASFVVAFFSLGARFLTARQVTRSLLEIRPSESQECLSFNELHYYTAEVGVREEIRYHGDVYMNQERTILSMPAYLQGQVRAHPPAAGTAEQQGKDQDAGAVLAFGNPKGYWQPTVSCVFVDGPIEDKRTNPRDLCKTIVDGSEEHTALYC